MANKKLSRYKVTFNGPYPDVVIAAYNYTTDGELDFYDEVGDTILTFAERMWFSVGKVQEPVAPKSPLSLIKGGDGKPTKEEVVH